MVTVHQSVHQIGPREAPSRLLCVESRGLINSFNEVKGLPASPASPVTGRWYCELFQLFSALEMSAFHERVKQILSGEHSYSIPNNTRTTTSLSV